VGYTFKNAEQIIKFSDCCDWDMTSHDIAAKVDQITMSVLVDKV